MKSATKKRGIGGSNRVNGGRVLNNTIKKIKVIEKEERGKFNIISPKDKWFCNLHIPSESISGGNGYFENNTFNATKFTADMNTTFHNTFRDYNELNMSLSYGLFATEEAYTADIGPIWGIYVDYEDIEKNAAIYESMIDDIIGNFPGSKRLEVIYTGQKPSNGYQFCKDEININSLTSPKRRDSELLGLMKDQSIFDINSYLIAYRDILN